MDFGPKVHLFGPKVHRVLYLAPRLGLGLGLGLDFSVLKYTFRS